MSLSYLDSTATDEGAGSGLLLSLAGLIYRTSRTMELRDGIDSTGTRCGGLLRESLSSAKWGFKTQAYSGWLRDGIARQ